MKTRSSPALAIALLAAACAGPPAPPTTSAPAASAPAVLTAPAGPPSVGPDDAPGKRSRARTAVILFGVSAGDAEPLRFVPALCSLEGKLQTGKTCGLAMPPTARVRTTRKDTNVPAILTVTRSTRDYHDEAGDRKYVAPAGPACCMYNTCVDETIPYTATGGAKTPAKVLAVWPETADVDLKPQPGGADGVELADGPWAGKPKVRIEQALRVGGQRLATTRGPCGSCGALWVDQGGGFASVKELGPGADGYDILATSDVDGDGRAEAIVYEVWRNDYGLHVLGNDWAKPAYRFSCGNI
jgi:hypothetical protein